MEAGSSSNTNMTCTLLVDTQNPGWLSAMVKVLKKLEGCVTHFSLDALHGIATISGKIDSKRILLVLTKVGSEHLQLERVDYGFHPPEIRLKNNQPFYDPYKNHHPSYATPTSHYQPPPSELLPKYNNNNHPSYNPPPSHHPPLPPPPELLPKYNNSHPSYNPPPPAPPRNVKCSTDDPDECSIM